MQENQSAQRMVGTLLVAFGLLLFMIHSFPGLDKSNIWPARFFILALFLMAIPLLSKNFRKRFAVLFVPGAVLLMLGVIFFYNTVTRDWSVWAFAWTLLPGGVGFGLWLASRVGRWGSKTQQVGFWMFSISLAVFVVLGSIFGSNSLDDLAPALLVALGLVLILRSQKPH
jgi:hypothetical protein